MKTLVTFAIAVNAIVTVFCYIIINVPIISRNTLHYIPSLLYILFMHYAMAIIV